MGFAWWGWTISLLVMIALAVAAGWRRGMSVFAIFIDYRNTWSLTQFQLAAWTFAILPVMFAFAFARASADAGKSWDFTIPGELWAVLGISLGSAAISSTIKQRKDTPTGSNQPLAAGERVPTRSAPGKASFFDMLAYDEGAAALKGIDVTKFQNLLFTLALVATFLWNSYWLLSKAQKPSELTSLPGFNEVVIGILGVSHAGYLTGKVIPQTGTPDQTDPGVQVATSRFV